MSAPVASFVNHYSVLGVDQKADLAAIEAAYKTLSAEFHPDNRKTGDAEKYKAVQTAYEVLSNPDTRADFDKLTAPVSDEVSFPVEEFISGLGADSARRLCLLCILYYRLKYNPISPVLPLRSITELMQISLMDLEFNVWYLKKKGLLTTDDKSRLLITVAGIDYVEQSSPTLEMIGFVLRNQPVANELEAAAEPQTTGGDAVPQEAASADEKSHDGLPDPLPAADEKVSPAGSSASITALSKVLAKLGNAPRSVAKPDDVPAEK